MYACIYECVCMIYVYVYEDTSYGTYKSVSIHIGANINSRCIKGYDRFIHAILVEVTKEVRFGWWVRFFLEALLLHTFKA